MLQDVFSFLVVFNYIIPISLYVTLGEFLFFRIQILTIKCFPSWYLEMQKFIGSLFFAWDEELRCPITGEIPICNSSDLNEELGQVSFFSCNLLNALSTSFIT